MSLTEFEIISRYFNQSKIIRKDVALGIGDDCALLTVPDGQSLAVSTDTIIEEVHFLATTAPENIGYRALAVSLSDLAAMGAEPAWVMLALTLPAANETWLAKFSEGFFSLCHQYEMQLVGGNLSKGALSITTQVFGFVPFAKAMKRNAAQPADLIYVTGTLGDAGLALQKLQAKEKITGNDWEFLRDRYERPTPRIREGKLIRDFATAAIDISDGLTADLSHILTQSQVGAVIYLESLPLSSAMRNFVSLPQAQQLALKAGDDYELCFTVAKAKQLEFEKLIQQHSIKCTCIGRIEQQQGLRIFDEQHQLIDVNNLGYQHF